MSVTDLNREIVKQLSLPKNATVREVIAVIDQGGAQIALITEGNRLVGLITDGDVRRALLRGELLESKASSIMRREFVSLRPDATPSEAFVAMRKESIHQIPVVDSCGGVAGLFLLEELLRPKQFSNPVVIMAGGEGTRLLPLTRDCPKPMLRINGKPLLEIILDRCMEMGFDNFYFSVNYLKEQIKSHFEDGARWNVSIRYIEEDEPMGTAGALTLLPERPNQPVLVLNGDVLTRVDYQNLLMFHSSNCSSATLCVREHATQIPYGVVSTSDTRVLSLEEKPTVTHLINSGIYVLNPEVIDLLPSGLFFDMPALLDVAVKRGKSVNAFVIHEDWLDVGIPETFERAGGKWV